MTFENYQVVAAPFPYVEKPILKRRPCLIIGSPDQKNLVWVLMITTLKNESWKDDVTILNIEDAGLKFPSVIRTAKIATVEIDLLKPIGFLDLKTKEKVKEIVRKILD